jgi:hypothetical protein
MHIIGQLSFVLVYKTTQRFGSWLCLRHRVNNLICWVHWRKLISIPGHHHYCRVYTDRVIQSVPYKTQTHEPFHVQNNETNGNIEFLQPCPIVAVDSLLQIGTARISAVL